MNKLVTWLGALLGLQLLIAIALFWADTAGREQPAQRPLLAKGTAPDRIVINDGEREAELLKTDTGWQLPTLENLPADADKVSSLLRKLREQQTGWPVTTTDEAHRRFAVADNDYKRRLRVLNGETVLANLFVGSSPGLRQVHLRRAGEDPVYAVSLSTHEVPAAAEQWLDKTLLQSGKVTRIQGADFTLSKSEQGWHLDGDAPANPDKAKALARAFENLRVQRVAPDAPEGEPAAIIQVGGDDSLHEYRFWSVEEDYLVQREDRPQFFTISEYDYNRTAAIDREALTQKEDDSPADTQPE